MTEKKLPAYMTLEAALIMPFAIALNILVIYFSFFLYNQCTISQGCYLAALRGSHLKNSSDLQIQDKIEQELEKLLDEQIFTNKYDYQIDINVVKIKISAKSKIEILFQKLHHYKKDVLVAESNCEVNRLDAVSFIRKCRLTK